jgi:hypothetical protein
MDACADAGETKFVKARTYGAPQEIFWHDTMPAIWPLGLHWAWKFRLAADTVPSMEYPLSHLYCKVVGKSIAPL